MVEVRLAIYAMATRFELILKGDDPVYLRAAGEEALREIVRLEELLSIYRPTSELSRVNREAAEHAVRVVPEVFLLLKEAQKLAFLTEGAFDMTVGPLVQLWRACGEAGRVPSDWEIEEARRRVGMQWVELDEEENTVRFTRPGISLDPGAIGKGYAVDKAITCLRENTVSCALLHGGSSTVYALGAPGNEDGWRVALRDPVGGERDSVAVVTLRDAALSVSAPHGRWFEVGGQHYGHVIDPRVGRPIGNIHLAAAVTLGAMQGDALSTALLVQGSQGLTMHFREHVPILAALVLEQHVAQRKIHLLGTHFSIVEEQVPIIRVPS